MKHPLGVRSSLCYISQYQEPRYLLCGALFDQPRIQEFSIFFGNTKQFLNLLQWSACLLHQVNNFLPPGASLDWFVGWLVGWSVVWSVFKKKWKPLIGQVSQQLHSNWSRNRLGGNSALPYLGVYSYWEITHRHIKVTLW